jgi:hypothetical protein
VSRRAVIVSVAVGAAIPLLIAAALSAMPPPRQQGEAADPVAKAHDERLKSLFYPGAKRVETEWDQVDWKIKLRVLTTPDDVHQVEAWYMKQLGHEDASLGGWEKIGGRPESAPGKNDADLYFDLGGLMDASSYGIGKNEVKRPVAVRTLTQTKPEYSLSVVLTRSETEKETVIALSYTVLEGFEDYFKKKK